MYESLSLYLSISLTLPLFGSLSLSLSLRFSLSLRLSPHTHALGKDRQGEKEGLPGCEWDLHEGVQVTERCTEETKKKKLMILPLLFQAQDLVQELLDASKLKKEKKESHRFGYKDLDPRNVRLGETRNQSTAWSESFCMHPMLGFPTSLFSSQHCSPRAFFFWGGGSVLPSESHNDTPPTVVPKGFCACWFC